MRPLFLGSVEAHPPQGDYAATIEALTRAGQPVPGIMRLFAYKPERTRFLAQYTHEVMRGASPLSPGFRELIAAYTSRLNHCPFWILSHAAVAAELLGDRALVDAVLEDPETAPISPAERVLLRFVRSVNSRSFELRDAEVEEVRAAGWTDEALYDAISVCGLFNFYNRWCDGAGVDAMPAESHLASGRRMALYGYAPRQEK